MNIYIDLHARQIPSLFWRTDSVELIEGVTTDTCKRTHPR